MTQVTRSEWVMLGVVQEFLGQDKPPCDQFTEHSDVPARRAKYLALTPDGRGVLMCGECWDEATRMKLDAVANSMREAGG